METNAVRPQTYCLHPGQYQRWYCGTNCRGAAQRAQTGGGEEKPSPTQVRNESNSFFGFTQYLWQAWHQYWPYAGIQSTDLLQKGQ